jgi:hypothetical protein
MQSKNFPDDVIQGPNQRKFVSERKSWPKVLPTEQVHSCRSEDALAQKRCEIKAEDRGDGSKKNGRKIVKN